MREVIQDARQEWVLAQKGWEEARRYHRTIMKKYVGEAVSSPEMREAEQKLDGALARLQSALEHLDKLA